MLGDQCSQRLEEDQLGYGWSLWTTLQDALAIDAFHLNGPGTSVEVKSQLQMQRRISKLTSWFDDGVQVDMIIEAREIRQAGDGVGALMFGYLSVQHAADGNAQTILAWSGLIPREVFIQGELPPLKVRLSHMAPYPVQAAGEGNGPLHLVVFGNVTRS